MESTYCGSDQGPYKVWLLIIDSTPDVLMLVLDLEVAVIVYIRVIVANCFKLLEQTKVSRMVRCPHIRGC